MKGQSCSVATQTLIKDQGRVGLGPFEPTVTMSFSSGLQLRVVKGQSENNRVIRLDGEEFTLGRGQQGQKPGQGELLFLESSVSRLHASLTWKEGKGFQLTHRSSTNPTMVNGKSTKKIMLEPGDRIQMGLLILMLEDVPGGRKLALTGGGEIAKPAPVAKAKEVKPERERLEVSPSQEQAIPISESTGNPAAVPQPEEGRQKRRERPAFAWKPPEER